MTHGVLGIIACPMVDDNLVYSLSKDGEDKSISIVANGNESSVKRKLERSGMPYATITWDDVIEGNYRPVDGYNIIILMLPLGLHAEPKRLKDTVEEYARQFQKVADGIGFYLGTFRNHRLEPSIYYCRNSNNGLIDIVLVRDGKVSLVECKSGMRVEESDLRAIKNLPL